MQSVSWKKKVADTDGPRIHGRYTAWAPNLVPRYDLSDGKLLHPASTSFSQIQVRHLKNTVLLGDVDCASSPTGRY